MISQLDDGSNGTAETQGNAWAERAGDLAAWAWARCVNRTDVWGGYNPIAERGKTIKKQDGTSFELGPTLTRPKKFQRGLLKLTETTLARHFGATGPEDVVGLHTTTSDNLSKWGAVEVDKHTDEGNPAESNWAATHWWYTKLVGMGFHPLLTDSNGKGGYHLRVFFDAPLPTALVFWWLRWLTSDHGNYGIPRPESFPKQSEINREGKCPYGNWLRLPGRHHTRDHWASVWDGEQWLEGSDAVNFILSIKGDDGRLVPDDCQIRVRVAAYLAELPNLGEGNGRDDVAYRFAAFLVRDLALSDADALPWLSEWDSRNSPPKGDDRLREIIKSGHEYGQRGYGSGLNGQRQNGSTHAGHPPPPPKQEAPSSRPTGANLGSLRLAVSSPRQTASGKLVFMLSVAKAGQTIDQITVTSSASGRKEVARALATHLGDDEAKFRIPAILGQLMVEAAKLVEEDKPREGETLRDIIPPRVLADLRPAYRTARGIWSESRGEEIGRVAFVSHTPSAIVDAASEAIDAPVDDKGVPVRYLLVKAITSEMGVIWADLMRTLPIAADSILGADTEAAKTFWQAMVHLWTKTQTWELSKGQNGDGDVASRASLVSRVRTQAKVFLDGTAVPGGREKWRDVQKAFDAWWRPGVDDQGQVVIYLGMRYTIANQVGVELPGVTDQTSLTTLGRRFGCVCEIDPVSAKSENSRTRLAVLSAKLTEELLAKPEEPDEEDDSRTPGHDEPCPPEEFCNAESDSRTL